MDAVSNVVKKKIRREDSKKRASQELCGTPLKERSSP